MSDDFNAPEPFRKGKSKIIELKAWQSRQGDSVKVTKFRCWDGFNGCETFKDTQSFKWHPLICNACSAAICTRFGVKQSDFGILSEVLSMEDGLFRSIVYLKAKSEKVDFLRRGQEIHVKRLMEAILKDPANARATIKAYRDWFYDHAGIEIEKPKHVHGMVSVAASV